VGTRQKWLPLDWHLCTLHIPNNVRATGTRYSHCSKTMLVHPRLVGCGVLYLDDYDILVVKTKTFTEEIAHIYSITEESLVKQ
jgi:hypothetical protein